MQCSLHLPALDLRNDRVLGSSVRQLRFPAVALTGTAEPFRKRLVEGHLFTPSDGSPLSEPVLIVPRPTSASGLPDHVLVCRGGLPDSPSCNSAWLRPRSSRGDGDLDAWDAACTAVLDSWKDQFHFLRERRQGATVLQKGLRPPQIGALHAVLSHWTVSTEPATVVMPTGTGKTEAMVALLVAERLRRVLVVVPTDALRDQIAGTFLSLGILRAAGIVAANGQLPIVGALARRPKTVADAEAFFRRCNVVVTTAQIAGACDDDVRGRIASLCTHLFVDEAHHVRAPTWERVRASFEGKLVVQFTATPYRGDGKLVDGKVVYNYPLRKAQEEGYFRPIRFRAVEEFSEDQADERVAHTAVEQLTSDLAAGHDHLLMARCNSIRRATAVHALYERIAAAHRPVLAHSELPAKAKRDAVERLRSRQSRVVVCVDMFGEGFDLPELKVAAVHDVHKSLAVTLQFTGRFTRSHPRVGDATVVANTADANVEEALQALYGEDPDWNFLLREISEQATGGQVLRTEFLREFTERPERIPLQNISPKMSTVVFETRCPNWRPERAEGAVANLYDKPALNPKHQVLLLVTKEHTPIDWGDVRGICNTVYDLYLLHWDKATKLLFIHSSNKNSAHEGLAKVVCGDDVRLVRGERVFRTLEGINRLILTNLGLGHSLSRSVRFTMHVGADIREGLSEAHAQNKYKTNLFGRGYAGGEKASIGCSARGRVWSFLVAHDIAEWIAWCHVVGRKLLDDGINVRDILSGVMIPTTVKDRPPSVPIAVEWSEDLLSRSEDSVHIELASVTVPFYEVGLQLEGHEPDGPIQFRVSNDGWLKKSVSFEVKFRNDGVDYVPRGAEPNIVIGKRKRPLAEYLQNEPPVIRFHDGSFLIYDELFAAPAGPRMPFNPDRIECWSWTGVDLKKESQRQEKRPDSIQRRVIERILAEAGDDHWDVVFDDDEHGEAADVVAIRVRPEKILVRLYHCKYTKSTAGKRVKDLYEVCGQAQRSVYWKGQAESLVDHLLAREAHRIVKGGVSRFERGDTRTLKGLKRRLRTVRPEFQILVVQPGLSRAVVETSQLELLAVTELYLQETYNVAFGVIAS